MRINALEDGKSEFSWGSTFDADEGADDGMKQALEGL